MVISIDGNIGAGKSTLIKTLKDKIPGSFIIPEPVEKWTELLTRANKEPKKYGYQLQELILEHYNDVKERLEELKKHNMTIIVERSALTALLVFTKDYVEQDVLSNMQYSKLTDRTNSLRIPYDIRILVDTSPNECLKRIKIRNRGFEVKYISLKYLERLDGNHTQMYNQVLIKENVFTVKGNQSKEKMIADTLNVIDGIQIQHT